MSDPTILFTLASAGTAAIAIASATALRGWREWLDLRQAELRDRRQDPTGRPVELLELRARVRRLESIASGTQI